MFKSTISALAQGALAVALAVVMAQAMAAPSAVKPVEVGRVLPDVTMSGLNGPQRKLSSYRGKNLIINVWASWCAPCRAESASLERLAWSEAGSKFVVVGVSTDDDRAAALKWLKRSNATLNHYIDAALEIENLLGASHIPLTVLVDPEGRVVARFPGAREWDEPESVRMIERAFEEFRRKAGKR